jgi:oxygen-dependent protoporphyrinogen oxidase
MKIVILGGGISGLSAAWYARKKYPTAHIAILEKTGRLGGSIETNRLGGFLFEKGPRTFAAKRSPHLLGLIDEMGLKGQLLFSSPSARRRFLWVGGKLRSFFPSAVFPLLREPFRPKGRGDDESIYDFAMRRFGRAFTNTFIDPMTLGIYAGDIQKLSIQSCFPSLYKMEQEWGSLVFARLFGPRKKGPRGLFTLKDGMETLVRALADKSEAEIHLNAPVEAIQKEGVFAKGRFHPADLIVSGLDGPAISNLTGVERGFAAADLWLIRLAFEGELLPKKGFGYLVPTQEKEDLLGMIWDSCIFPEQNLSGETRVTAMMREGSVEKTLDVLKRHLGITQRPMIAEAHKAAGAIPQFHVGYAKRLEAFQVEMKQKYPSLLLTGNYLKGASVDACIAHSKGSSNNNF